MKTLRAGAHAVVGMAFSHGVTVLRCFVCDWGYTVKTDVAEEVGADHDSIHSMPRQKARAR